MTLPRVYALFDHWTEYPPAHVAMKAAWLGSAKKTTEDEPDPEAVDATGKPINAAVFEIMQMEGMVPYWPGPPPIKVADVMAMAGDTGVGRQRRTSKSRR